MVCKHARTPAVKITDMLSMDISLALVLLRFLTYTACPGRSMPLGFPFDNAGMSAMCVL